MRSGLSGAAGPSLGQTILDLVPSVPPELAAYAQLRLVEKNIVRSRNSKVDLIESAFSLSRQSPYSVRKVFAYGNVDSRAGQLSSSYDLRLDALSLQAEAVSAMLRIDPERARNLFAEIGPLKLDPFSCSDVMVYDPSAYYQVAGEIFRRGFNRDDRTRGLDADFLVSVLQGVANASETKAAADLLLSVKLEPNLLERVETTFGRALTAISGDRRSFDQTQNLFLTDLFRLTRIPGPGHKALLSGARSYFIANYSGEACADSTTAPPRLRADGTISSSPQEGFRELDGLFQKYGIAPIDSSHLFPTRRGGSAENTVLYWRSQPAHQLEMEERTLILTKGSNALPDWQARTEEFLTDLRNWTDSSSEPSADDFYIEKSTLYSELLIITPLQSPVFQDAITDFASFLTEPPPSDAMRIFWLSNLHFLGVQMKSTEARKILQAMLQRAPNPSLALWGYLDTLTDPDRSAPQASQIHKISK